MSHFLVVVQLPESNELDSELADALSPYDENKPVEPYDVECECVRCKIRKRRNEKVDERFGKISDLREAFDSSDDGKAFSAEREKLSKKLKDDHDEFLDEFEKLSDRQDAAWRAFIRLPEREAFEKEQEEEARKVEKPDADCEECHGTGRRKSTYNQKSQWDWYSVGGRWPGFFDGKDVVTGKKARELLKAQPPYAIVTKDGAWHQRGKMGWWGMSHDEMSKDEWAKEVGKIADSFDDDDSIVAVDCHI